MDSYGLQMDGAFVIQRSYVRPEFTEQQIGRFVFVESDNTYWFGGVVNWISIGVPDNSIGEKSINWGFNYNQINAKQIPFNDSSEILPAEFVHDALISLSTGIGFKLKCLSSEILMDDVVKLYHVDWGFLESQINAESIPIKSKFRGLLTDASNVQESINRLETNSPIILRKTIDLASWEYNSELELYRAKLITIPITNKQIAVQCFNSINELISPANIQVDSDNSCVYIWLLQKDVLAVTIIG